MRVGWGVPCGNYGITSSISALSFHGWIYAFDPVTGLGFAAMLFQAVGSQGHRLDKGGDLTACCCCVAAIGLGADWICQSSMAIHCPLDITLWAAFAQPRGA
jgi:hypothetical protein